MCPKQEEKEGLDRLHLHKPGTFGRRDHSDLWETLADRGVLQDLQVLSSTGNRMSQPVLRCPNCPCSDRIHKISHDCDGAAPV